MNDRTTDQPLKNPDLDLLGLGSHAQRLAELVATVPTPYTIGVYGQWGAGKTTFAFFVERYLKDAPRSKPQDPCVEFVHFEAWPHKTADELWRALIIKIAAQLYYPNGKPPTQRASPQPATKSFARWLASDAIVVREELKSRTHEEAYADLLAKLDSTLYGGIGKGAAGPWKVDQEQAMVAAVKAGVSALGAISPLIAGLGGLFTKDGDGSQVLERKQNEETRARIESIEHFRELLAELLEKHGNDARGRQRRLCIFLDDLDRCAPDLALDLLDAIKVFLVHPSRDAAEQPAVPFVFVLAADEEIIGRGLRMRYREFAQLDRARAGGAVVADQLAREGQQYFEKIVQLRIHIPEANPQAAHRFITAQFPEWMPATDIIFAALGSNPRRVKQYCSWMMYRHSVERLQAPTASASRNSALDVGSDDDVALLNKLIALHARSPDCLHELATLAAEPDYAAKASALERHLDALGEDASDAAIRRQVSDASLHGLCGQVSAAEPLFKLFREPKRFSEYASVRVETFAAIADMGPRGDSVLECSDRVFMRTLQQSRTASVPTEKYVIEEFGRLRTIELHSKELLDSLLALAKADKRSWTAKVLAIEARVESGKLDPKRSPLDVEFQFDARMRAVIDALLNAPSASSGVADRRELLLKSPRLSHMLPQVVEAYCKVRVSLQDAASLLAKRIAETASEEQKADAIAKRAYAELGKIDGDLKHAIEERLELRRWAAAHCLWLRSFAKLNALDRNWPDFARNLRGDFAALRAIEAENFSPGKLEPQYLQLWEQYQENRSLRDFLRLQPLFSQIDPAQLRNYLELTPAVAPAGPELPLGSLVESTPGAGSAVLGPVSDGAPPPYTNIRLSLKRRDLAGDSAGARPAADGSEYSLEFQVDNDAATLEWITLDWAELDARFGLLRKAAELANMHVSGPTREFASAMPVTELLEQLVSLRDYSAAFREIGSATFETVFTPSMRERLEGLPPDKRYRFVFEGSNEAMAIPFELLYSSNSRSFLALSQRYSLVRFGKVGYPRRPLPITLPLRILVVLANPQDSAPLNLEGEEEVLQRAMQPAIASGRVSLEFVRRGEATWERVRDLVRSFRPHVFHFVGHGVFGAEVEGHEKRGSILLENAEHKAMFIPAPEFGNLLGEEQIQIAVLNGCDTGTAARNEAISSLADALTNHGVPAVIATTREVADDTALLFSREFYRSLSEGQPLEFALVEARKALSVERRDWSVYALFASMLHLDLLRLPGSGQQRGPERGEPMRGRSHPHQF
jgi:hypothetical protein